MNTPSDIRNHITVKAIPRVSPSKPPPTTASITGYSIVTGRPPPMDSFAEELEVALYLLERCYRFIPDGHELGIEVGKFLVAQQLANEAKMGKKR